MPVTIPPFAQYQAPLIAVPGRWNWRPPEGDHMIPVEIDWLLSTANLQAVELSLTSFSPVQFSQIVALSVDNNRCGADIDFLFPDTGKQLTVPAGCQGTFPVFTNSMTFYAIANGAITGDVTLFTVLNSMPPPVAVQPSEAQSHASVTGINLATNATTTIVPAPTSGTIEAFNLVVSGASTTAGQCDFVLQDGTPTQLYHQTITLPVGQFSLSVPITGIRQRFSNGLFAVISLSAGITSGNVAVNVYYSVP